MSAYGCYVKFTARPGQRDALVEHLLHAAAGVRAVAGCQLYLINTSPTEPECVWVTEVWRSQQEHDAALAIEGAHSRCAEKERGVRPCLCCCEVTPFEDREPPVERVLKHRIVVLLMIGAKIPPFAPKTAQHSRKLPSLS
jgi:quinol monooxygenase YgiN